MTLKSKHLNSLTIEGTQIVSLLRYNTNTNHITIGNNFSKSNDYKLKPINKESPAYLGMTVAEQLLEKVFKNVQKMPYGNKGYNFKCSNGFLIDSKASCKIKRNNHNSWAFIIKKNKIPDYFALLAFDNRDDLTPKYFWLIPGHVINDKTGIGIYESTLSKYDKYRQDINKVIKCCNNLKDDIK